MAVRISHKQRMEKRLKLELEDVRNANMKGVWDIQVDDMNIWKWKALIVPWCVPYNEGAFRIEITIPDEYPFKPPQVLFRIRIYHPNVDREGYMHFETASRYWSPAMQMEQFFRGLIAVVNKPEPYHPSHPEIYKLSSEYNKNREEFIKTAIKWTSKSEKRPLDSEWGIPREVGKVAIRLRKELQEVRESNIKCITDLKIDDIWNWRGLIVPDCAPYTNGAFRFEINFPPEYPAKAPKIHFRTKIYHPNVYKGKIDMSETCIKWNGATKMIDVLKALIRLFREPDVDHFPPSEVAELYYKNYEMFLRTAEQFTKEFAEKMLNDECPEVEGRCPPFMDNQVTETSDTFNILLEGKCIENNHPRGMNFLTNNTENSLQLQDNQAGSVCCEVEGKQISFIESLSDESSSNKGEKVIEKRSSEVILEGKNLEVK